MTEKSTDGVDDSADAVLLTRHVEGDPDAFAVLVARHRDRLWAVALRTLGDPDDAADALQDALIGAFRRADTFRGDAAVTTWLHRVVVNACLDQLRRRRARPVDPVDPLDDPALSAGLDSGHGLGGSPVADPESAVLNQEVRAQVLAALATLPPEQRVALALVDMQGWSIADAAQTLNCAPGTVKSRCSRGRARLAPLLADLSSGAMSTGPSPPVPSEPPARGEAVRTFRAERNRARTTDVPSTQHSAAPSAEPGPESTGRAT